jgi:hypothetical protein
MDQEIAKINLNLEEEKNKIITRKLFSFWFLYKFLMQ